MPDHFHREGNATTAPRRMLPEWEQQRGVLLTWPHAHSDWRTLLTEINPVYVALSYAIAEREPLFILCHNAELKLQILASLKQAKAHLNNITLLPVVTNDTWIRDYGPIALIDQGQPRLLKCQFNGWGGKFAAEWDNQAVGALQQLGLFGAIPLEHHDFILEGGGIESDGQGTVLTTARCFAQRYPHLAAPDLKNKLSALLGAQRIIILEQGYIPGDDTDGHIDTLVRFCDPATLAYSAPAKNSPDPDLSALENELQQLKTLQQKPYRLVPLPLPQWRQAEHTEPTPANYANFLIINDAVILPTYDDPADHIAQENLRSCFPNRDLILVPSLALVKQGGSIHCATMPLFF